MGFYTYIIAALLAAALGAVLSFFIRRFLENREFDRVLLRVRRRYNGRAHDYRLEKAIYVEDAQQKVYEFAPRFDFSRDALREYSLYNVEMRFGPKKIFLNGMIRATEPDGSIRLYSVDGRGEYMTGDMNSGLIMFRMHSNDDHFSWKWVCFLKYANPTDMSGYWTSPDTRRPGSIHGGWIAMKEVA
jgi:hypothetical protein